MWCAVIVGVILLRCVPNSQVNLVFTYGFLGLDVFIGKVSEFIRYESSRIFKRLQINIFTQYDDNSSLSLWINTAEFLDYGLNCTRLASFKSKSLTRVHE